MLHSVYLELFNIATVFVGSSFIFKSENALDSLEKPSDKTEQVKSPSSENEVSFIAEVNYSKLNFVQVARTTHHSSNRKSNRVNVVDQILNQKNMENFNSLLVHQYREITQFKPSKLITNGARRLACILSEDKKRIIILDTNDQEDERRR
ncbi:unnamed protein product [Rhizophagus irregularis]|nr:unnamed protein product [Rhizophagus irregularis]